MRARAVESGSGGGWAAGGADNEIVRVTHQRQAPFDIIASYYIPHFSDHSDRSPHPLGRSMPHWREEYLAALAVRDQREKANVALYDACSCLAAKVSVQLLSLLTNRLQR